MSEAVSPLDEVRDVLFGDERRRVSAQDQMIAELQGQVTELEETVERLESLIDEQQKRAVVVGEVLVEAVETPKETPGELGSALRSEIEHAVHESARTDSVVLAEALYPVMGPAMRKMIASIFTLDNSNPGDTFVVEQVLLIEREGGLLLASVHRNSVDAENADVVSGMLDAIRLFVQDAFDKQEHDGLRNLRVGDTSVLVEWGPRAVLASVVQGIPTDEYRASAALTLEQFHATHAHHLENFSGDVSVFEGALSSLGQLREQGEPPRSKTWMYVVAGVVLVIAIILLLIWLL